MLIVIHLQARYQPLGVTIVNWDMVIDWWVWSILLFHLNSLHYFPLLYLIAEDNQTLLSMSALRTISNASAPFHFNNNGCLLTTVVLHQQQAHTPNRCLSLSLIALPPLATSLLSSGWLLCCILLDHCILSTGASAPLAIVPADASASCFLEPLPFVVLFWLVFGCCAPLLSPTLATPPSPGQQRDNKGDEGGLLLFLLLLVHHHH
jgi:hypothetical protein